MCIKRKRIDEDECSNLKQTISELKHTVKSEYEHVTDSDFDVQANNRKPKKVKYQHQE